MLSSKLKLDCLVQGYLRQEIFDDDIKDKANYSYEESLSNIIVEYLLLREYFNKCNPEHIILSDDKLTIRAKKEYAHGINTCYGTIKIPSTNESIHHWIFKIIQTDNFIAIGIDETNYTRTDKSFFDFTTNSKVYGIWSDGDVTRWDKGHRSGKSVKFGDNDTVEMILDLKNKSISIRVNEQDKRIVVDDVTTGDEIEYCMAVALKFDQTSVRLLNYYCD